MSFRKFTAASSGLYTFMVKLGASPSRVLTLVNTVTLAVWVSDTDPLCLSIPAAYTDPSICMHAIRVESVTGTPPLSGSSPSMRTVAIHNGTGAWLGRDGQLATVNDSGHFPGEQLPWRYSTPENGTRVCINSSSQPYYLKSGVWTERGSSLVSFTLPLESGQRIYLRIGTSDGDQIGLDYGCGLPYGSGTDHDALVMSVSMASP
jgi:hypothetical protein